MRASELIRTATGQLGVCEEPAGSNLVRYNADYYGKAAGYPWCCVFVWWCFREAGGQTLFYDGRKTASCTTLMNWARKKQQLVTGEYKPGDILFYQFDADASADHVGICTEVLSDSVIAIEGNTGSGNAANGGKVMKVLRPFKKILAAWRPAYEAEPDVSANNEETFEVTMNMLKKGSRGRQVRAVQLLLIGSGFDCGADGADGEFGPKTLAAVKAFQQSVGITADGIVGSLTWRNLFGV